MDQRQSVPQPVPQRISVTVPGHVYEALRDRADREGRTTSNLCAYLLEVGLGLNPADS